MNAYELNQMCSGIKVGDKVRVVRKAEANERNWPCFWAQSMDCMVGNIFRVDDVHRLGVLVGGVVDGITTNAYVPYFVLEVVE